MQKYEGEETMGTRLEGAGCDGEKSAKATLASVAEDNGLAKRRNQLRQECKGMSRGNFDIGV